VDPEHPPAHQPSLVIFFDVPDDRLAGRVSPATFPPDAALDLDGYLLVNVREVKFPLPGGVEAV